MSLYSEKNDYIGEKETEYVKIKMEKLTLINLFKKSLNILRDREGITGGKALRNMTYLFVLKLLEPKLEELKLDEYDYDFSHIIGDEEEYKKGLFKTLRFTNLSKVEEIRVPDVLKNMWEDVLSKHPTTSKIFLPGSSFDIKHQNTFKKLIDAFNSFELLSTTEYDVLGNAYEEVVKDMSTGKALGQFFTPPSVKNLMIKLIDPKIREDGSIETCGDPTMGTGGFLITYLKYIIEKSKKENVKLDWEFIKNDLYGKEKEPETYQLAVSNMLISSGHMFENLEMGDSIREPITRKFDNVLANPPFGIEGFDYEDFAYGIKNDYVPIKSKKAVSLFIQAIIYMLKINGKCAVVLPYGSDLFSKTDTSLIAVREYLMKTCDLKEIIILPQDIFTYTDIKTCIFYFVKKVEGSDALEIVDKKLSTRSQKSSRSYKFSEHCQTKSVKFYDYDLQKDSKNLIVEVSIEKIVEKSYSLYYSHYINVKEEKYKKGIELKTLGEICIFEIGGTPSRNKKEYYENGNNLWVSVRELNGGYIYNTKEKLTDLGVKNSSVKLFKKDTVLFSFKLSIGKTAIVGNPLYTNEAIAGINTKDNNVIINNYLYYYLSLNDFSNLGSGLIGTGSLNKQSLEKIQIPIPSIEVQQHIVKYLDFIYEISVKTSEEKIQQLKKANEMLLKNQQIFGVNEVKSLGEVCEFKNGKGIRKENLIFGEYPVIGGGQNPMGFHNEYNNNENVILCSSSGAYAGFISRYNKKVWASDCFSILPKNIEMNDYIYYFLKNSQNEIYKLQSGAAQPHVYSKDILTMKISIPSLERQKEIVEYCDYNETLILQLEKEIEINKRQASMLIESVLKSQTEEEATVTPKEEQKSEMRHQSEEKHTDILEEEKSGSHTRESLDLLNITTLKNIARNLKIPRYSTFKSVDKPILIGLILKP
jgi:type I restriction-modification system DNA methylase subunit/restriction endonuclease S subunit